MKATALKNLKQETVISKVGPLFTADQRNTGVLAAVSLAQFILESAYGKSELAQKANNCFGMKKNLSGNTWSGSTWDGKSVYTKETKEQEKDGTYRTITADFRKYSSVEDSIADHSAYLLGAKNGSKLRYSGLKGCTDYKKAAQIIKDGGYATSLTYVDKLCNLIEKYDLTQYNAQDASDTAATETEEENEFPYLVKVKVSALNVRKGPGTKYKITTVIRSKGIFTIVDEQNGWGRLKSGAGWIKLSYTARKT